MANNYDGEQPTENNKTPSTLADNGLTITADETANLSVQDLTVLETSVRGQVSGLVGALHPNIKNRTLNGTSVSRLDLRLHPELDERARQMPSMDVAISYRVPFLKALIDPDPRHHRDLIEELVQTNIPLQTLAIHLLCPIATELGNYWCNDDADFMQVAVASTRLSNIVNHLTHAGPRPTVPKTEKRILLARSRGTKHTLGVTLVRMCFQDLGWIVDGGADMEIGDTMYMRLSARSYDLLGLSVGRLEEAIDCKEAIERSRSEIVTENTKIVIGGAAVLTHPEGFQNTGADFVTRSALEAITLAEQAVG
ncbi:B12-binding domain-containing protein [Roseibium alexandrii]|uniref:cobalamin B12-binding domain-containing protein n=1 Tax=Roseibium alexandrii TaxID=388408 RepID=UPI003750CEBF